MPVAPVECAMCQRHTEAVVVMATGQNSPSCPLPWVTRVRTRAGATDLHPTDWQELNPQDTLVSRGDEDEATAWSE